MVNDKKKLALDPKGGKKVKPMKWKTGEVDLYEKYKYRYREDKFIMDAF